MKTTKSHRSEIHYSDNARTVSVLGLEGILSTTAASIALIMFAIIAWQNPERIADITVIFQTIAAYLR